MTFRALFESRLLLGDLLLHRQHVKQASLMAQSKANWKTCRLWLEMLTRHKKRHWMLPAKFPLACWLLIASLDKLVASGRKQLVETMHCLRVEWSVYSAYRRRLLMMLGCVHIISFLHSLQARRNSASNYVARIANFSACFFTRSKFNEKNFRCKWTCAQQAEERRRKNS